MNNRLIKVLILISIVFISFFIGSKGVRASSNCYWISPMAYINENNLPSEISARIYYETSSDSSSSSGLFGADTDSIQYVTSYRLKYDGTYKIGYAINDLKYTPKGSVSRNDQGGYNIYLNGTYDSIKSDTTPGSDCSSYQYVKASVVKNKKNFEITISGVSEDEYISYIKSGGQMKNLFSSNNLYGIYNIYAYTTNNKFHNIKDRDNEKKYKYSFYNMINATGGTIYFVNMKERETYPTEQMQSFKEMMNIAESSSTGNKLTDEEKEEALNGLGTLVDTGTTDNITYTKAFYTATKEMWLSYMGSVSNSKGDTNRREYFSRWFSKSVARYVFEDDISQFLVYWKYIYFDDCSYSSCDLDSDGDNDSDDKKIYNNIITILTSTSSYDSASDCLTNLESDPCISICTGNNADACNVGGTAVTKCKKSSTYTTCTTCAPKCSSIGSASAKEDCYNSCTDGKYSTTKSAAENQQQEAANDAAEAATEIYYLTNVTAPSLDIEFNQNYELDCEDVEIFHKFYVIMEIAAPILVIVFGTLDYAKAVIASDVEKIEKAKKKFPKRLMLLFLFVLVPIIVNFFVNGFSSSNTNLMYCIINGS